MIRATISGLGMNVPETIVKNDDLIGMMETSDEWIRKRTGIEQRRFAGEGISTSSLAVPAAEEALSAAGLDRSQIDLILFATLSPDHHFPGSGCYFQAHMKMPGCPVMDIRNQCSGFVYGLATASAFIEAGTFRNILLVGSEVHSHSLDMTTRGRDVSVLFGDGAGAAVISRSENPSSGIISSHLHADGRFADSLCLKVWDISRKPYIHCDAEGTVQIPPDELWPQMNGREVFKHAVTRMSEVVLEACAANQISPAEIDLIIPHQANKRINEMVARILKVPAEKVVHTIGEFGNTTAASIPMAMYAAEKDGRLKRGMTVMLVAFGSGFTWGSTLLRY